MHGAAIASAYTAFIGVQRKSIVDSGPSSIGTTKGCGRSAAWGTSYFTATAVRLELQRDLLLLRQHLLHLLIVKGFAIHPHDHPADAFLYLLTVRRDGARGDGQEG